MDEKTRLRNELREKGRSLEPEERERRSRKILKKLFHHPRFLKARAILTYIALGDEVETRPLLEEAFKQGKKVYAPRVDEANQRILAVEVRNLAELEGGAFGILEPPFNESRVGSPKEIDLVVVPAIGFDRQGGRLGRGAGYFDRFLEEARQAYKIGLAFDFQIVQKIPREPHDVLVNEVLIG